MTTPFRKYSLTLLAAGALVSTQACKQDEAVADAAETASASSDMLVGPEAIAVVKAEEIRSGPALSGQLSAETQSTVRAEVSGAVLQTYVEVGSPVHQGQDL